jgi:uncharacterized membrane protein YbhN (UPF0104 family)
VVPFAGWSLLSTFFDIGTFYFLLRAFLSTPFIAAPATYPWIVMASGIPLSMGGLGLREGAAVALLSHFAVTAAVATDAALFLFAFLSLLPALGGGMLLLMEVAGKAAWPAAFAASQMRRELQVNCRVGEK